VIEYEDTHEVCPCCKEVRHVLDMRRVNGHRMCEWCMHDYGDYMMEQQRDKEMMEHE